MMQLLLRHSFHHYASSLRLHLDAPQFMTPYFMFHCRLTEKEAEPPIFNMVCVCVCLLIVITVKITINSSWYNFQYHRIVMHSTILFMYDIITFHFHSHLCSRPVYIIHALSCAGIECLQCWCLAVDSHGWYWRHNGKFIQRFCANRGCRFCTSGNISVWIIIVLISSCSCLLQIMIIHTRLFMWIEVSIMLVMKIVRFIVI